MASPFPQPPAGRPRPDASAAARFEAAFTHAARCMALIAPDGRIRRVNHAFAAMMGVPAAALEGTPSAALRHPDELGVEVPDLIRIASRPSTAQRTTRRIVRPDGGVLFAAVSTAVVTGPGGHGHELLVHLEDLTSSFAAAAHHEDAVKLFETLTTVARGGIFALGAGGVVTYCNAQFRDLVDLDGEADPKGWPDRIHPEDAERMLAETGRELVAGNRSTHDVRVLRRDGTTSWARIELTPVETGGTGIHRQLGTVRDVTSERVASAQLTHLALHDALTGLPNRTLFLDRLTQALARARRRETPVAVLFFDVDRFKVVNDSLGREAGDQLLIDIAARLDQGVRPSDTLARFGGDELAVLCEDLRGPADALLVADRLMERFAEPFALPGGEVYLETCIGVAICVDGGQLPEDLLRDAEAATHRAKETGKARIELYDDQMRAAARERLATESALRRGIDRGELRAYYQPVVDMSTLDLVGFEALVRWQHPERGLLAPYAFVELAEEIGLVGRIDRWMLTESCRQLRRWHDLTGRTDLEVNVNLSPRQLLEPELVSVVGEALSDAGLRPEHLVIEITERAVMDIGPVTADTLAALRALGVRLAIDDFGTGYSSLAHLRSFPVDLLKIDRGFTADLFAEGQEGTVAAAILSLGHALGLKTVAEGIERPDQLEALRALGCELGQGYHFARPLPADEATALLLEGAR